MSKPASFVEVIDRWPSRKAMQTDLQRFGEPDGKAPRVFEWASRNTIPVGYFDAVVAAAAARGFMGITYETLTQLRKARKDDGRESRLRPQGEGQADGGPDHHGDG